jgi:hypothetical protein
VFDALQVGQTATDTFTYTMVDSQGATSTATVTITIHGVNDNPTDITLSGTHNISQSGGTNAVVGALSAADVDNSSHTFTLVSGTGDGGNGLFNIVGTSLRANDAAAMPAGSYSVRIMADDGAGGTVEESFTITVTDDVAPSVPVDADTADNTVAESAATGMTVGVTASSVDTPTSGITYTLTDDAGGRFAINPSTGVVSVAIGALLDGVASHTVTVQAKDAANNISTQNITIGVSNISPTLGIIGASAINEGATYTLTLTASDPGDDTISSWSVNWGDGSVQTVTATYGIGGNSTRTFNSGTGRWETTTTATHIYADGDTAANGGPTVRTITATGTDEDGTYAAGNSVAVTVNDVAPTITLGGASAINEGSTYTLTLGPIGPAGETLRDPLTHVRVDWGGGLPNTHIGVGAQLTTLNSGGTIDLAQFYADGPGTPPVAQIRVYLTNGDGVFEAGNKTFQVTNLNPTGSFTNGGAVDAGQPGYVEWYNVGDASTADAVLLRYSYDFDGNGSWELGDGNWGGSVGQQYVDVPGSYLTTPGAHTVRSRIIDKDGGYLERTTEITVNPTTFRVLVLTPTISGFDLQFNRAVDLTTLNLYDGYNHSLGSPDMTVIGAHAGRDYYGNVIPGPVAGSLVWDAPSNTMHFVKTGGSLAADTYTVTLYSRTDGWVDTGTPAHILDGDANGSDGGNYVYTFTVGTLTDRVLSVPDFARGPRQPVNVAANGTALGTNLPIFINDASSIYSVDFTLVYDPSLLTITVPGDGVVPLGSGMPSSGWTATANFVSAGQLKVSVSGTTPLPSGSLNQNLVSLVAGIPEAAPYLAAEILRFTDIRVNEGGIAAVGDNAIHKVAFLGDATGEGSLSGTDASRISRAVVGLDGGFSAYPLTDPVIIADATGDRTLSGLDASYVARKSVNQIVPTIPDVPYFLGPGGIHIPYPVTNFAGVDPTVQIGDANMAANPGDTVHAIVRITDHPQGLDSANFTITYDTGLLSLSNADVTLGKSLVGKGWTLIKNVTGSGVVYVTMYGSPLTAGTPELLDVAFHVRTDADGGTTILGITGLLNEGRLTMTPVNGSIVVAGAEPVAAVAEAVAAPAGLVPAIAEPVSGATQPAVSGSIAETVVGSFLPIAPPAVALIEPASAPQPVTLKALAAATALDDLHMGWTPGVLEAVDSLLQSRPRGKRANGIGSVRDAALTELYGAES